MPRINALIRHYYNINPEKLSDSKWAQKYNDIRMALEVERENQLHALRQVLNEAFSKNG